MYGAVSTSNLIYKKKTKIWLQVCAIFSVSIAAYNAASLFYWTSPSIPRLISDETLHIDLEAASYLTVIPSVGLILGSPIYSILMDAFGRKYTILTMSILHLTSWILIAVSESINVLYVSRLIYGLGDACLFAVIPVYIAEITTPAVRNSWGNVMMFLVYFGQFSINAVGFFFSIKLTAIIFMVMPVIFFCAFIFMPESPYYYVIKGKPDKAGNSLKRLRGGIDVDAELEQIQHDVQRQLYESGTFKNLIMIESNRKALLLCSLVRGIQQFGGISAFALYTQYIFGQSGAALDKGYSAMIYTGMLAFCNIFGTVLIDKLGNNLALVISCLGCSVALFAEATFFFLQEYDLTDLSQVTWIPLLGMLFYVIFFSVGLGIVPTVILGELFSASVKSKAACIMNVVFAALIGMSTKMFQLLASNFGFYVPFAVFGGCTLSGAFLIRFFVPETKGKTLEEIQQLLKR